MFFEVKDSDALQSALSELCSFLAENSIPEDCVFDSKLVLYELVGNILRHSGGVATVHGAISGEFVELKVFSSSPFVPPEKSVCSEVYAESGRGLFIVDKVCAERSYTPDGAIKVKIKIR
ncbi:MAG: ATP-binding protein [Clostridia bacterium]|nr:ATP-binding protein [Clostridia bacterium]